MSDYAKLLAELSAAHEKTAGTPLAKAMAAGGGEEEDEEDEEGKECKQREGESDEAFKARKVKHDKKMAKSFEVTLPNGQKVEAQDGRPMLKAFAARVDAITSMQGQLLVLCKSMAEALTAKDAVITELTAKVNAGDEKLNKALEPVTKLSQTVENIANQGRGRRSVTVQTMVDGKKAPAEMNSREFLGKAMELAKGGKLGWQDLANAELAINKGLMPDSRIVELVQAAA